MIQNKQVKRNVYKRCENCQNINLNVSCNSQIQKL